MTLICPVTIDAEISTKSLKRSIGLLTR